MSTAVAVQKKDNKKVVASEALTPEVLPATDVADDSEEFAEFKDMGVVEVREMAVRFYKGMERQNRELKGLQTEILENFWRFGKMCAYLTKRSDPGSWSKIIEQLECSKTHANNARSLYYNCSFENLSLFKTKTAALRAFGILPELQKKEKKKEKPKSLEGGKTLTRLEKPKKMRIPSTWAQPVVKTIRWIEESDRFNEADLEALEALAAKIEEIRARAAAKA